MLNINWRSPEAYRHAQRIPAAGLAWEYLRRDEDYQRDFERLKRMKKPSARRLEEFSKRWGLRFPAPPGNKS